MEEYLRLYNLYHRIFMICLIGTGIFLVISIILFFVFKVWMIIGDLTGRTARKMVKKMKAEYRFTANKEITTAMLLDDSIPVFNNFQIEKQIILIHTEEMI